MGTSALSLKTASVGVDVTLDVGVTRGTATGTQQTLLALAVAPPPKKSTDGGALGAFSLRRC